ncbi:peptidoglycan-binding domain-containing protein [Puia dinghuensis]|uniref:Peptidoglycan-binding protein n=1 Tax=Puia dinghuensis TaxID=1792502 RepID=A0A8J2UAA6_9BACT|nr:peptidoglycan-binding domain-containing protein [Puia dinghuensis]GGA89933.1 hypothetical protein GCM10011511_11470 [Puia dinghuensis]
MESSRKKHTKKVILTSIAVSAAGVLGYFGWQFYRKIQQKKAGAAGTSSDMDAFLPSSGGNSTDITALLPSASQAAAKRSRSQPLIPAAVQSQASTTSDSSDFPLKKGMKGEIVRLLQKALIAKYGASILPKYGADGGFGPETVKALKKIGLPATIDESTYNVLVQSAGSGAAAVGKELYTAVANNDFNAAITALKKLPSTSDYTAANATFKTNHINGVRQTIVNGLLNTFTDGGQQQQIKFEFLRIGLQFNGSKWSLSGLGGLPIITIRPAAIWINARRRVSVPARVVLGNEVSRRLDYTLFENQGQYFLVPTRFVRYM